LCALMLEGKFISAFASPPILAWLKKVDQLAAALKKKELTSLQWQQSMEQLLSGFALSDFLKFIDFDALISATELPQVGESFQKLVFQSENGVPEEFIFYKYLVGFRKGRSIPPHGHDNLVSSFIVLNGELHGRHFERVRDDGSFVHVQPTLDQNFLPGNFSTVSDMKNNVHWFTALKDRSFLVDFGVSSIDPNWKSRFSFQNNPGGLSSDAGLPTINKRPNMESRVYLDILNGIKSENLYRVARIQQEEAYKIYGS
jgi:hypothetical protein